MAYGVWLLVTAGWCWRWAYERWPEMRLALGLAALLLMLAAGRLAERLHRPAEAPPAAEAPEVVVTEYAVVRFGTAKGGPVRMGGDWCDLSHCPLGVIGYPDEESAQRGAEGLPGWMQPHIFRLER